MTQFSKTQFSFAGGVFSPSMYGRSDLDRWQSAVSVMENMVARPEGPAMRRSGTRFVVPSFDETKVVRLIPFVFSNEDAYVLELTEGFARVFKDEGVVQDGGATFAPADIPITISGLVFNDAVHDKYQVSDVPLSITSTGTAPSVDGVPLLPTDIVYVYVHDLVLPPPLNVGLSSTLPSAGPTPLNVTASGSGVHTIKNPSDTGYVFPIPYLEADLPDIRFAQSADVIYLVHEDYAPRKISRFAADNFQVEIFDFFNGPYRAENLVDADTVSITVGTDLTQFGNAVSVASVNDEFVAADVGRFIRVYVPDVPADKEYVGIEITGFTNTKLVTGTIESPLVDSAATVPTDVTTKWSLGKEVEETAAHVIGAWPRTVSFHEQRLTFGGSTEFPENLWMSRIGRFDDFSEFSGDAEVNDDDAITLTLGDDSVKAIRWIKSNRVLVIGTNGGIYNIDSARAGDALTANSFRSIRVNAKPSDAVDGVVFESMNSYVSLTGRKIRGSVYDLGNDTYQSDDLSIFSDSILDSRVDQLTYADEPHSQLHARLGDGGIASLSFIGRQEIQGWNTVKVGGTFRGGAAVVESFATIPSPETTVGAVHVHYSQVWVAVRRTIDDVEHRYIEFFEEDFEDNGDLNDAFFVDSGLSTPTHSIVGISNADPAVIDFGVDVRPDFVEFDRIIITHAIGMTEVNDQTYFLRFPNAGFTSFQLHLDGAGDTLDSTGFGTYTDGGVANEIVSSVSGLDHAEGELVQVVADGSVRQSVVVSSGAVAISPEASEVHIGLPYTSTLELLPLDQNIQQGSGMGKIKRVVHVDVRLKDTVGGKVGVLGGRQETLTDRLVGDALDSVTGLAQGWISMSQDEGYTTEGRVAVIQDQPMPITVVAITRSAETVSRS